MGFGQTYLSDSAYFPSPEDGGHLGDHQLTLAFAGGPYRFVGLDRFQTTRIRGRFGGLCESAGAPGVAPVVETRVLRIPGRHFSGFDPLGWEYTFDRRYHADSLQIAGLDFLALLQWRPGLCGTIWVNEEEPDGFMQSFENLFRVLVAYRIQELGGMLLHSAAIARGNRAYLFLGRSGAGKTTLARLAQGAGWDVLSDDMNAVLPATDGWTVEQMPFSGDLGQTASRRASYSLAAVLRLCQGPEHRLTSIARAELAGLLVACSPFVNADSERIDRLFDNVRDLGESVTGGALYFRKDGPGFVGLLRTFSE